MLGCDARIDIHRIDPAVVRSVQITLELQVVGRVRENEVDALVRQLAQLLDAIAEQADALRAQDEELRMLVQACLAPRPDARPTMQVVEQALAELAGVRSTLLLAAVIKTA